MIQMRHAGVYVRDLAQMQTFYQQVFHMHILCDALELQNALLPALMDGEEGCLHMTKLITEQGKISGYGDMVELLEVSPRPHCFNEKGTDIHDITMPGNVHLCFGVDDLDATLMDIKHYGGTVVIDTLFLDNGRKCAFAADPEGNILEMIQ